MSFKATIFFGSIAFLFCYQVNATIQQLNEQNVSWYETFFLVKDKQAVEDELRLATAKLLETVAIGDRQTEARLRKEIGLINLVYLYDYEKAMDFFVRSLAIEDSLSIRPPQVFTYLAIAQVYEQAGNLTKSAESLEKALLINDQFRDVHTLVFILNKLGKINAARGRIDDAFENFELVLNYKDELAKPKLEAEALFNLAHLYTSQGKYDTALDMHKEALSIRRMIGDRKNEALSLNDIGELYHRMKNDEKAFANHIVALEIRQRLQDNRGIAESYNNIGVLYYQQKNFERSIANLLLALENANDVQAQEEVRKSYDYLSLCNKELGDFKKALEYRDLFMAINDLIQSEKNQQRLAETENQYTIDKKQSQIDRLESIRLQREREIQAQKQFRNFLMALVGLGVLVVLLIFYLYIVKKRSNKKLLVSNKKVQQQNLELQELNATKDKFFSIISHDLKGPLNSLTSFSGLLINHTDSLSKDEIRMLAKDLDKSLKNLFALLENLLEWSRAQTGNIEFKPEAFDLAGLLDQNKTLLQTQAQNKQITIENVSTFPVTVNAHRHSINTVIRNLISNAIKFTPEGGTITLALKPGPEQLIVSVKDTGVGMSTEVIQKLFRIDAKHTTKGTADEKGTGLGLILCREFVEKNGGRIWVESTPGKGSVFYFSIPGSPQNIQQTALA